MRLGARGDEILPLSDTARGYGDGTNAHSAGP